MHKLTQVRFGGAKGSARVDSGQHRTVVTVELSAPFGDSFDVIAAADGRGFSLIVEGTETTEALRTLLRRIDALLKPENPRR